MQRSRKRSAAESRCSQLWRGAIAVLELILVVQVGLVCRTYRSEEDTSMFIWERGSLGRTEPEGVTFLMHRLIG